MSVNICTDFNAEDVLRPYSAECKGVASRTIAVGVTIQGSVTPCLTDSTAVQAAIDANTLRIIRVVKGVLPQPTPNEVESEYSYQAKSKVKDYDWNVEITALWAQDNDKFWEQLRDQGHGDVFFVTEDGPVFRPRTRASLTPVMGDDNGDLVTKLIAKWTQTEYSLLYSDGADPVYIPESTS